MTADTGRTGAGAAGEVDVLAVGAHPDDVEMTCAGLLLKMKGLGYRTGALHLTRGEMGSRGTPEEREREAAAAAGIMRLDRMEILGLPDGRLRAGAEPVRMLAEVIRRLRPRLVIAPFPRDPHPDHAHAGLIAAEAVHAATVRKLAVSADSRAGEATPHYVGQLVYSMYRTSFTPSFVVDIAAEFEDKRRAVLAYASQVSPTRPGEQESRLSSPQFMRGWEARHVYHGMLIGAAYGEAYFCEYAIPLVDPVAAFAVPQQRRYATGHLAPGMEPA